MGSIYHHQQNMYAKLMLSLIITHTFTRRKGPFILLMADEFRQVTDA